MQAIHSAFARLSDEELTLEVKRQVARECASTADLIATLGEFDARRLYLAAGCSSLFTYCVQVLGLSEDAAYFRIEAARACRRFPLIHERLVQGAITLTAVKLLAPHLTDENHVQLLDEARGRTKRQVEEIIVRLQPKPDVPASIRKLPGPIAHATTLAVEPASALLVTRPAQSVSHGEPALVEQPGAGATLVPSAPPASATLEPEPVAQPAGLLPAALPLRRSADAVVAPLAPGRYRLQITVSAETRAKLMRAQDLLRHAVPDGDLAVVFDRALTLLVDHLEKTKCALTRRQNARPTSSGCRKERPSMPEAANQTRTQELVPERVDRPERRTDAADSQGPTPKAARARFGRRSRYIPAAVRRAVWLRDGGRCTFVGGAGRCRETSLLEYHHVVPFADGGECNASNLRLVCRRHNDWEARRFFGAGETPT